MNEHRWMTVVQVMRYLQVSRTTVYQWMQQGRLPYRELPGGRGRRFDRDEVDRLLAEPAPSGEALDQAIRDLHREMNAGWDAGNHEYHQVIHMLHAAAGGESLIAAAVERWLRFAEASNPVGTTHGRLVREAGRLLRARVGDAVGGPMDLSGKSLQRKALCHVEFAFTFAPNDRDLIVKQIRSVRVPGHPDVEGFGFDPVPGEASTYRLGFDFEAASAGEADEIAESYIQGVLAELRAYGPRIVTPQSCVLPIEA